jgi:hypothetical protein
MPPASQASTSKPNTPIALVEPQMNDVHHAPFNAALLHAVALAYPTTAISFRAFPEHIAVVKAILQENAQELIARVDWRPLSLVPNGTMLTRWRSSRRMLKDVLRARERVLFCSISRMQLLQLKRIMDSNDVARAVLHGDLESLVVPSFDGFLMSRVALDRVLQMATPPGLKLLLLGASIKACVPDRVAAALSSAGVIDHPYHFPEGFTGGPLPDGPLVFGMFGNTGDGLMLEQVARSVRERTGKARFRLVGFLSGAAAVERLRTLVEDTGGEPISRAVYAERGRSLTHALWLASPDGFRLRASGTFFDALLYAKPLVYTANPFIDSYYAQAPGIGIRCNTVDEVPQVILQLAEMHDAHGYEAARQAMLRFRERFTPQVLATALPEQLAW